MDYPGRCRDRRSNAGNDGVAEVEVVEVRKGFDALVYVASDARKIVNVTGVLAVCTTVLPVAFNPCGDDQIGHGKRARIGLQLQRALGHADDHVGMQAVVEGPLLHRHRGQLHTPTLVGGAEQSAVDPMHCLGDIHREGGLVQPSFRREGDEVPIWAAGNEPLDIGKSEVGVGAVILGGHRRRAWAPNGDVGHGCGMTIGRGEAHGYWAAQENLIGFGL